MAEKRESFKRELVDFIERSRASRLSELRKVTCMDRKTQLKEDLSEIDFLNKFVCETILDMDDLYLNQF